MEISDLILIVQTIILFLTGLVIFWYTYETQKIRKETKRQNLLIYEQIQLLKKTQIFEEIKYQNILEPVFRWGPVVGTPHSDKIKFKYTNEGSMFKIIKIIPHGKFLVEFFPKGIIKNSQEGTIVVKKGSEKFNRIIEFEIIYENEINENRRKIVSYDTSSGEFEEQKSSYF